MSFGTDVGGVHMTRSYTGENTSGLAKSAATARAEVAPVATVTVQATLGQEGTYALTVEASGQSTTVKNIESDALADRIARLIQAVSKAVANGELRKHRQSDPFQLGMDMPRPNRENLRFG